MRIDSERLSIPPDGRPDAEQPAWRRDFPIDWPQDDYIARRDFTKFLVLTSLAFAVGQFWIVAQNFLRARRGQPPMRRIASVDQIPVGGSLIFAYPGPDDDCVLVRTGAASFVAYSQKCTHLSCPVRPRPEEGVLHCPCHEGKFDLETGRPLAGPPRRALPAVDLAVRGGVIYAAGMREESV
jgi:Rieske Fe-S protein